jgi:hypothetical protein
VRERILKQQVFARVHRAANRLERRRDGVRNLPENRRNPGVFRYIARYIANFVDVVPKRRNPMHGCTCYGLNEAQPRLHDRFAGNRQRIATRL